MDFEQAKNHVEQLNRKATEAKDGNEAMKFSQAAVNIANAVSMMEHTRINISQAGQTVA